MVQGFPGLAEAFAYALPAVRIEKLQGSGKTLPDLFGIGQGLLLLFEAGKLSVLEPCAFELLVLGFVVVQLRFLGAKLPAGGCCQKEPSP